MAQTSRLSTEYLAEHPMLHNLVEHWWMFLARGICAVLFGIAVFAWPGVTLFVLTLFFGIYALADGTVNLFAAFTGRAAGSRWWQAIAGIAGIVAGIAVLSWPGLTAGLLVLAIALWAIASGVAQIVGGIVLRKEIEHEWLLVASGAVSALFGLFVLAQPGAGALAMLYVIGIYAILFGIMLVLLAFRLREIK